MILISKMQLIRVDRTVIIPWCSVVTCSWTKWCSWTDGD